MIESNPSLFEAVVNIEEDTDEFEFDTQEAPPIEDEDEDDVNKGQEDTNLSVDDNETPEKVVTLSKSTSDKIQGKKGHVEL